MGVVTLVACVALGAVFVVSGVAKLLDRDGTREAVAGFGVPAGLASPVALALAPAEMLVAALLLIPPTRGIGLVAALVLLVAFTAAVVLAINAGRRPDCRCFGRIGGADISGRTVARNAVLIALAVAGLAALATDTDPSSAATAVAVVAGLGLAAAILAAEGAAGRAARRRREAQDEATFETEVVQHRAPDFTLLDLTGGETSLADLLAPGRPVLLVTLSHGCGPCKRLRPDVARWAQVLESQLTVAVLATGTAEANLTSYADMPHLRVLVDESGVREELGTGSTPSAVVIGPDGVIASAVANGEPLVRRLLVSAVTGAEIDDSPAEVDHDGIPADELGLDSVVGPRPSVQTHPNGDSTVLLDTATGATVVIDQIGALVWSVLDGSSPLREIVADIADVFGAPAETVGPDVLGLVQNLGQAGLLTGVALGGRPAEEHVHAS